MFISRKSWNSLIRRVEELEKAANSPVDLERMEAAVKESWGDYSKTDSKRASTTLSQ